MSPSEIACPQCQSRFECPAERFGKAVRCGACQAVFTAPSPAAARVATPVRAAKFVEPEPRHASPRREVEEDRPRTRPLREDREKREKPAESNNNLVYILGGMGGLAVVGLLIFLAIILKSGSKETVNNNTVATQPLNNPLVPVGSGNPETPAPKPAEQPPTTASTKPLAAPAAPPANITPAQAIQNVKKSTVYIRAHSETGMGMGSGFFAGETGYVCTNAHVIGYGDELNVPRLGIDVVVNSGEAGQKLYKARVVGVHVDHDLALLWINPKDHPGDLPPPLRFGKTADLMETQEVNIFGFPLGEQLGLNISVNKTSISSLRKDKLGSITVVQVAEGMTNGNSGGPVANTRGEVIGVSVAGIKNTPINFAIPSDRALAFVEAQIASGGTWNLGRFTGRWSPRR
ncbi:MAG: trypsin-like peptidase domain-containing protein [Fimbriiglobus sp.]